MTNIDSHKQIIDFIELESAYPKLLVICGPTASGKTDFAHSLAWMFDAEIVNCDSMQIYKEIPIITASPSPALKADLPYHLYNFLSSENRFSSIRYAVDAAETIKNISSKKKLPIVVGGTGMYLSALVQGYNEIPEISENSRKYTQDLFNKLGNDGFFLELSKIDPIASLKLCVSDSQRIQRAFEVKMETGKSIFSYQEEKRVLVLDGYSVMIVCLSPSRELLYSNCNQRLNILFKTGAIDEIKSLTATGINISLVKAIGTKEIASYLSGDISLEQAITRAQAATRKYAKRQVTWFKNQFPNKIELKYSSMDELYSLYKR